MKRILSWIGDDLKNVVRETKKVKNNPLTKSESAFIEFCVVHTLTELGVPFDEEGKIDQNALDKSGGMVNLIRNNFPDLVKKNVSKQLSDASERGKSLCFHI